MMKTLVYNLILYNLIMVGDPLDNGLPIETHQVRAQVPLHLYHRPYNCSSTKRRCPTIEKFFM